jgi:hypothetical protein
LGQRITRAPLLEASCSLQIVQLAENLHACDFAQRDRMRTRRIVNRIRNAFARRLDILKRDQAFNSRALLALRLIAQSESGMDCN